MPKIYLSAAPAPSFSLRRGEAPAKAEAPKLTYRSIGAQADAQWSVNCMP